MEFLETEYECAIIFTDNKNLNLCQGYILLFDDVDVNNKKLFLFGIWDGKFPWKSFFHIKAFFQLPVRKIERDFFTFLMAKTHYCLTVFQQHSALNSLLLYKQFPQIPHHTSLAFRQVQVFVKNENPLKVNVVFSINSNSVETNSVHIFLFSYLGISLSISIIGAIHSLIKSNIGISFPLYIKGIGISVLLWEYNKSNNSIHTKWF